MTSLDRETTETDVSTDNSSPPQDVRFSLKTLLIAFIAFGVIASVAKFFSALLALLLAVVLAQYACFRLLRHFLGTKSQK